MNAEAVEAFKLRGMSREELAELRAALVAKKAQLSGSRSFTAFVKQAWRYVDARPLIWGRHLDALCDHLEAVSRGRIKRLAINIPPGHGKPVWEEEHVLERARGRVRLADIRVGDFVLTHRGRYRKVVAVHEQGELPLVAVATHAGRVVRAAPDHPFLTTRGWVEAQRLTTADVLAAVVPQEDHRCALVTREEARLLGYLVGDGSTKYQTTCVTTADAEIVADVRACAEALGWRTRIAGKKNCRAVNVVLLPPLPPGRKSWSAKLGQHPVYAWLERHGLRGKCSYDKRVPPAILASDDATVAHFLGAYWSCDGTVEHRGGSRSDCRVSACTVSVDLARDVQHLLLRLGVSARIRERRVQLKTRKQGDVYVSWNIDITSLDDAAIFAQRIPMQHAAKTLRITRYQRTRFDRVLREDPIVSIETGATTGACRCLTVEEDSSFTAADIAVHNSLIVSVLWPAWVWTWRPSWQAICASYSGDLAKRDAVKSRGLIESEWYQGQFVRGAWHMAEDQNTKGLYKNTAFGHRFSCGIDNGTGQRADCVILDDPIKAQEAHLRSARAQAERFLSTASTRFNSKDDEAVVIIMQRLHEDDTTGYVLAGGGYVHLCMPAEFESYRRSVTHETLPDGTEREFWRDWREEEGEVLFPAEWPRARLEKLKRPNELGDFGYAGQMQQRPAPEGGGMFKTADWRFWRPDAQTRELLGYVDTTVRPRGCVTAEEFPAREIDIATVDDILLSVDGAGGKETTSGSLTAIHIWARKGARRLLLYRCSRRMDFTDTVKEIKRALALFAQLQVVVRRKLIEAKASGSSVINTLEREHGIAGIEPVSPNTGDKVERARAMQPYHTAHNVELPEGAPWVEEYILQHAQFPNAKVNDDVDAQSQGLAGLERGKTAWEEWADSDEDVDPFFDE